MALRMARPWKDPKTGTWHLRQRVPRDLVARLKGRMITLPVGDSFATVHIGDVVQVSLRTKDPRQSKQLHAIADAALRQFYDGQRNGPVKLSHKQAVALAGLLYREQHDAMEADGGDFIQRVGKLAGSVLAGTVAEGLTGEEAFGEVAKGAIAAGVNVRAALTPPLLPLSDADLEDAFGEIADAVLAKRGLTAEAASRSLLLNEIRRAMLDTAVQLHRKGNGDYGPDPNLSRFPEWTPPENGPAQSAAANTITARHLFSLWEAQQTKAPNTVRRYAGSWDSFIRFMGERDVRTLEDRDVHAWAIHRRDVDGLKASVVNKNDLVAVSSVFRWAASLNGGRILKSNPVAGVRLEQPRVDEERERTFRADEVATILHAAANAKPDPRNPTLGYAKRWCPWLAAYSGARITEIAGLTVADIRSEGSIPVMHLRKTKTGKPRTVPLHEHILEQGFIEFVQSRKSGPLFYDPARHGDGARTSPAELRGAKVAAWVRQVANLDPNVDPNHGWRHTFKTRALDARIEERLRDAITGHRVTSVARGYEAPSVSTLAEALMRFPRYAVR